MRLALVLDHAGRGGTERHVESLCRAFSARGDRVGLFVGEEGPLSETARTLGCEVVIVEAGLGYAPHLARALRSWRAEVVHAHSGRRAVLAARLAGAKRVLETRHGIPFVTGESGASARLRAKLEGLRCRLPDITIAVCASDAKWLIEVAGAPRARVSVVRNGIAPDLEDAATRERRRQALRAEWRIPASSAVLGFVGRLSDEKQPQRFLDLIERVNARGSDAVGVIVGAGPLSFELRGAATARGLDSRLRWLGDPDARPLLGAFDLLVTPSLREGAPYVLLEALAEGLPILATPVGGVPEMLAGAELSQSLAAWDPIVWTDAVVRLLGMSPLQRDPWRSAALLRASEWSESRMLSELQSLYAPEIVIVR